MTGGLIKKSFRLAGHSTSVALEPEFWAVLEAQAKASGLPLAALIGQVDLTRAGRNLASALRVFVLQNKPVRESGET